MARVSKENSGLLEELARLKAARAVAVAVTASPAATENAPEEPTRGDTFVKKPSRQHVCARRKEAEIELSAAQ